MAKTTDPSAKPITLFLSPQDQREVKTECAALGYSYTEYFLYLHQLRKPVATLTRKKRGKK